MNERMDRITSAFEAAFGGRPDTWVRAPGRVDLMGSHTDYNLGFVLTVPISRDTIIAARPSNDGMVRLRSLTMDAEDCFPVDRIEFEGEGHWTNYVRGVAAILREQGFALSGLRGVIDTNVPIRSGLSSSAALECAVAVLFRTLGGWSLDAVSMAKLCQRAENELAGVNCGILDQYTACAGRAGCALLLDCRDLSSRPIKIADGIRIVICDTRSRRELAGSEYGKRRAECELGARIMGAASLRDCSLQRLENHRAVLPESCGRRCQFILEENARVLALAEALSSGDREAIAGLCTDSFRGAADLYEIAAQSMVAMMDAMMAAPGTIGSRQAGAGFGGCMVAFVEDGATEEFSDAVCSRYSKTTGIEPYVYQVEAAPGASVMETLEMEMS